MVSSLTLIGMPASGKSTIGKILANDLNWSFIDGDKCIEEFEDRRLQDIIDNEGEEYFLNIEKSVLNDLLPVKECVFSPGGSIIYYEDIIDELKSDDSIIIFLSLPYSVIEERMNDIASRGIVGLENNSLKELFEERNPLYEKYSDFKIDCEGKNKDEIIDSIKSIL